MAVHSVVFPPRCLRDVKFPIDPFNVNAFMKLGRSIHVQESLEQKVQIVDGFHHSTQLYYTNRTAHPHHMGSCVVAHIQS